MPDIEKGSYPFKDVKLNRADVEWLLATHESEGLRGPVDWSDERQRIRQGLDLRGADLRKAALQKMPLSRTIGGLFSLEKVFGPGEPLNMAAVHLEQADLKWAHLEGALLFGAHLEGADLYEADLRLAQFHYAYLRWSRLVGAKMTRTFFEYAFLEGADLYHTNLKNVDFGMAHLEGARFMEVACKIVNYMAHT